MPTPLPPIGRPAASAIAVVGVTTLEHVADWARRDVLALHGVGPKAVGILDAALDVRGLGFRATDARP